MKLSDIKTNVQNKVLLVHKFSDFGNMYLRMILVYILTGIAMTTAQTPEGFKGKLNLFNYFKL